MPHQCVRCGKMYDDGSENLLSGCACGGGFFFYIKKSKIKEAEKISKELSPEQRVQIEKDVTEIVGEPKEDQPVYLDLESIRILQPGKYELDLVSLFKKGKPVVYKVEDGKYIIDLAATLDSGKN
jgi:uncharacterized protein